MKRSTARVAVMLSLALLAGDALAGKVDKPAPSKPRSVTHATERGTIAWFDSNLGYGKLLTAGGKPLIFLRGGKRGGGLARGDKVSYRPLSMSVSAVSVRRASKPGTPGRVAGTVRWYSPLGYGVIDPVGGGPGKVFLRDHRSDLPDLKAGERVTFRSTSIDVGATSVRRARNR